MQGAGLVTVYTQQDRVGEVHTGHGVGVHCSKSSTRSTIFRETTDASCDHGKERGGEVGGFGGVCIQGVFSSRGCGDEQDWL